MGLARDILFGGSADRRAEKRVDRRFRQQSRQITLRIDDREYPFVLCNLSAMGASGRCTIPLEPPQRIVAVFENGAEFPGVVRWARTGLNGIAFARRLPHQLIVPEQRIQRQRERRIAVVRPALVIAGDTVRRAMIRNVSIDGIQIQTMGPLKPGQTVKVQAGRFEATGQVRWAEGDRAGLRLFAPMCLETFEKTSALGRT